MKFIPYIFLSLIILMGFSSCEDPIVLDLEEAAERLVIEANFNATDSSATVLLSMSNPYYEDGQPEQVSNAVVSLAGPGGNYTLTEGLAGNYRAINLPATIGAAFTLSVTVDQKTYTSTAIVPAPITLDSLSYELFEFGFGGGGEVAQITTYWVDQLNIDNYYRIKTYHNGAYENDVYNIGDDAIGDGENYGIPIQNAYEQGDSLRIELLNTNKGYYDYFFDLSAIQQAGFGGATPYNPKTNFDQDVLGYFGIYQVSEQSIFIE